MNITTPVLSYLQNPAKTLPMLLIEVPTTLGRTYQGYKQRGKSEAKEKICEETLGAAVWLFGVSSLNKLGDVFGQKVLKLKDLDVDVGKDALRNPFENVTDKRALTAIFKFSKIISAALLTTVAMGMVVPKLKQAMTNALRMQEGLEPIPAGNSPDGKFHMGLADKIVSKIIRYDYDPENPDNNKKAEPSLNQISAPSMKDFVANASNSPKFTGASPLNAILYASHNLENNTAWRLLSTDTGTLAGRVFNSRTKKEKIEYFTRDSISSFFYIFAAPLASKLIRKITKTPDINPKGALETAEHIKRYINMTDDKKVPLGHLTSELMTESYAQRLLSLNRIKLDKNGVITLEEFNRQTGNKYVEKARLMSELQPQILMKKLNEDGVEVMQKTSILSEKQVVDTIFDTPTSDPTFLKRAISLVTDGKSDSERSYISRRKLEKIRDSFDDFVRGLDRYSNKKHNPSITADFVDKYVKKLNRRNLAIHLAGYAVAIFGLAYLIPKLQYIISDWISGNKLAASELESDKDHKKDNLKAF